MIATIDLASAPDVITFLGGKLWAIDTGAAMVTPIDASTLQPGRSIGVAKEPLAIAGGFGSVWISGVDAVTRIDAVTSAAREIPVDIESSTVAVDPRTRAVWLIRLPPRPHYNV